MVKGLMALLAVEAFISRVPTSRLLVFFFTATIPQKMAEQFILTSAIQSRE
jgi:hypothetical protein